MTDVRSMRGGDLARRAVRRGLREMRAGVNAVLGLIGQELVSANRHDVEDQEMFIPLETTLAAARAAGLSVGDYIDTVLNKSPGATLATIEAMERFGAFAAKGGSVVEIGPGSGRFLEHVMARMLPGRYEIYETAKPWAGYLAGRHRLVVQPTHGFDLAATASATADLVHAHKVFSSIAFMPTCCYWAEMIRVLKPGGFAAFDIMTEACLPAETVERWIASGIRAGTYPAAVPRAAAVEFFKGRGADLVGSALGALGPGQTELLVFRKAGGP
ncbi:MAG: class I SAM-dependent methyltransferase [Hyphomicrobiaceae bacterium]|nr:class I SAM-dependent methyltransferase [Hyphomicrobiaceae bacterium]